MTRIAVKIEIFPRAQSLIDKELRKKTLERHYYLRFQIIKKSYLNMQNIDIAKALGCGVQKVRRWRKRWNINYHELLEYEKGHDGTPVSDKALEAKIKEILSDYHRVGGPSRITEVETNRLVALACESPEKYGLPFSHWTHEQLSTQIGRMGIQISPAQVGRLLKKRFTAPQE